MRIGKLAEKAGVGVETVRFYERRGLIDQPLKPQSYGFRSYPKELVQRIRFIRHAQTLGFTLTEIEELLALRTDPATDCSDVRDRATAKTSRPVSSWAPNFERQWRTRCDPGGTAAARAAAEKRETRSLMPLWRWMCCALQSLTSPSSRKSKCVPAVAVVTASTSSPSKKNVPSD